MSPRVARFFVPGPLPCLNDMIDAAKGCAGKGYGYATMKKQWTENCFWRVKEAAVPRIKRARFDFHWIERDRGRNPDNVAAAKKFVFDSLVLAKVLDNDGWKQIAGWNDTFEVGPKPGVEVTITEVEAVPCSKSR